MTREEVMGKSVLREGDLVLFDAMYSPDMVLGRLLRTGDLVNVTGVKFINANSPMNSEKNRILNKNSRVIYENVGFICRLFQNKLVILNGAELLDLIINPDAARNKGRIYRKVVERPSLQPFFYAFEWGEKHKDEGD